MDEPNQDITQLLTELQNEPAPKVAARLMPLVYDELRKLADHYLRGERLDHTLQPTALVHEVFLKLVDQSRVDWQGRTHFFAVGAGAMRRVLIDHARTKGRAKRGGGWHRVIIDDIAGKAGINGFDLIDLADALEKLAALDADQARVVELRLLGGLKMDEVAAALGVSKRKVEGDWAHGKAWLRAELGEEA